MLSFISSLATLFKAAVKIKSQGGTNRYNTPLYAPREGSSGFRKCPASPFFSELEAGSWRVFAFTPSGTKVVDSLLQKGAIELAPLPSLGYYSRLFIVMKASWSWRPVIDLSLLNLIVLKIRHPEGCVSASSNASGIQIVASVHGVRQSLPIQGSLLWSLRSSSGLRAVMVTG